MAVFVACFDAGGSTEDKNAHVLSIAGWIAPESKWRRLESRWREILRRQGVTAFHMKDVAHHRGEFTSWKGDEDRRRRFLSDLAEAITHHTNRDFSVSMFLDGYREVERQFELSERIGHPYMQLWGTQARI